MLQSLALSHPLVVEMKEVGMFGLRVFPGLARNDVLVQVTNWCF